MKNGLRPRASSSRLNGGANPTGNGDSHATDNVAASSNSNGAAPTPEASESQAPALQRGLTIIELLAARDEGATLSEISSALQLSPASIFRLTGVLEESGYVIREEPSRRFRLTRKLLLLAQPQHEGRSLVESCLPAMREVLQLTGETVQLCVLANQECVMIEQLASTHPFKYIVDIGSRPPAYCAAPGKAMMAHLPEAELSAAFETMKLEKLTDRTLATRKELLDDFAKIRTRGFAVDHGEHFDGIHCVAAPLLDRHGYPVASITIAGPSSRIQARRFSELGEIMKRAAVDAAHRYLG